MKKMINDYIEKIEDELRDSKNIPLTSLEDLKIKIAFFQHERLIHFLVTMLVSIITIILLVTNLFIENLATLVLLLIFIILLIPYYFHYYFLENRVQYMYRLYDSMRERVKK